MSKHTTIGFVGLGLMGGAVARRLLDAGYPVVIVPGPHRTGVDTLAAAGASVVEVPAALASACTTVFTCLPSSHEVMAVARGENGLMKAVAPGFLHIDLTSGDPSATAALAAEYGAQGLHLVDAAMAGMPEHAAKGELTLMVGTEPDVLERAQPLLQTFSRRIVRTGGVGTGQRTKLIMSFIGMAMANATAEALLAARATGVDLEALRSLVADTGMNSSTFQSMALAAIDGNVARRKLTIANAMKDIGYFMAMIEEAGLTTAIAPATLHSLQKAASAGEAQSFVPALTDILCRLNGLSLREGGENRAALGT